MLACHLLGTNSRFILGGTAVLNSADFVNNLSKLSESSDALL